MKGVTYDMLLLQYSIERGSYQLSDDDNATVGTALRLQQPIISTPEHVYQSLI